MNLTLKRPHQARLDLIEGLKTFVAGDLVPGVRSDYQSWVERDKPTEEQLRDRSFMDAHFSHDARYQASRGLQRLSQEAMWREVINGLDEQRDKIEQSLDDPKESTGSLELDPDLIMPRYYDSNEFHLQPGNFHRDALAGPIYELGVATYTMHRYGRAGDEMGRALLSVLPNAKPLRTLYLGCGPGYKAYPLVEAYKSAEHHAVDLSAPMLKYAHQRATEHNKPMHFHQMNAESLTYEDNHFDLVYCKLLLHEVPTKAIKYIVKEAARVLKPGGVFANLELPDYDSLDPLSAYLMDWDSSHNGEPFWRSYHELDLLGVYKHAGLSGELVEAYSEWGGAKGNYMGKFAYHVTLGVKPE
jgi:SAM-dependent methyltransferase